jgi:ketosteroid isomerase-like protein
MRTKALLVALSAVALTACTSNKTDTKTEEENISVANRVFEYFNQHHWAEMAELYVDPAEFKDPSFGQEVVTQTRQQTIEKYKKLEEMSSDIRDSVVHIYPSGDKYVIVEFVSSGTAPNGATWKLPLCTIFTIENGKIIKDFTYYDKE